MISIFVSDVHLSVVVRVALTKLEVQGSKASLDT